MRIGTFAMDFFWALSKVQVRFSYIFNQKKFGAWPIVDDMKGQERVSTTMRMMLFDYLSWDFVR